MDHCCSEDEMGARRGSSMEVRAAARRLRREETPAERALWRVLRNRAVNGLRFRRQHPMGGFVLDFYCPEVRLCVELDGPVHDAQPERDAARTAHLDALGITVLRFRNEDVLDAMPAVLRRIAKAATRTGPRSMSIPSPTQSVGEGGASQRAG
jgi:very-short-patch-repair endonuclease